MKRVWLSLLAFLVVALLMAGSFFGGALFQRAVTEGVVPDLPKVSGATDQSAVLGQVRSIIRSSALEPSSDESITTNAIEGMLSSLPDTYAAYYDPKDYGEFQMDSKGEFFGIGITIGLDKNAQPLVNTVFDGSPADKAGLKTGDVFSSIDGVTKKKWDLDDVVSRVRGPIGTTVKLGITRAKKAPFTVTITRDRIVVPNVMKKSYPGGVGYVRLMSFNERSADDLAAAMRELEGKGARGFVLDLRGNPGGLLRAAVQVVSLFVEDGVVVRVEERGKPEEVQYTTGGAVTGKPLVVLVDGMSASASEIVAGALQDHRRATIVGETSFGKGSVQTVRPLSNGGAVKLTTAHYLTPKKRVIDKKGVKPDVAVKMDPAKQEDPATDVQLKRAIETLKARF